MVVGPLVYSLALGMSVERRLGQGDRQPRHRGALAPGAGVPRRHPVRRERGARRAGRRSRSPTAASCACTRGSTSRTARWWPSSSAPCWCRASRPVAGRLSGCADLQHPDRARLAAAARPLAWPTPTRLIELVSTSARWVGEASQRAERCRRLRLEREVHRERLAAVVEAALTETDGAVLELVVRHQPAWRSAPAERSSVARGPAAAAGRALRARLVDLRRSSAPRAWGR